MKVKWAISFCAAVGMLAAADMTYSQAQQILKDKGYYAGEVDGIRGPQTEAAIGAFQHDQGLKVTGTLDDRTTKQLKASVTKEAAGAMKGAEKDASSSVTSSVKDAFGEVKGSVKSTTKSEKQQ